MNTTTYDFLIVGAGIAGASLAWHLAPHGSVLLAERERQPGMHSTGRSAAMFMETYGSPQARALTRASRAFCSKPPAGFAEVPILHPRGVLYVGWQGQETQLREQYEQLRAASHGQPVEQISAAECLRQVPVLNATGLAGAVAEPLAMDIDVDALHQGFLRGARHTGASLWTGAELLQAHHHMLLGYWDVKFADGRECRAKTLINAAGAWADECAVRCGAATIGFQPMRRSAFVFDAVLDDGQTLNSTQTRDWPAAIAIDESWYFKPDAGLLLGSPANADPVDAHDVQPDELDIATAIAHIEAHTRLRIRRPRRTWAGLRTFSPDEEMVIGADLSPGFFWLAGQGGYGIQSAAGAGAFAAGLLLQRPLTAELRQQDVDAAALSPLRFR